MGLNSATVCFANCLRAITQPRRICCVIVINNLNYLTLNVFYNSTTQQRLLNCLQSATIRLPHLLLIENVQIGNRRVRRLYINMFQNRLPQCLRCHAICLSTGRMLKLPYGKRYHLRNSGTISIKRNNDSSMNMTIPQANALPHRVMN